MQERGVCGGVSDAFFAGHEAGFQVLTGCVQAPGRFVQQRVAHSVPFLLAPDGVNLLGKDHTRQGLAEGSGRETLDVRWIELG